LILDWVKKSLFQVTLVQSPTTSPWLAACDHHLLECCCSILSDDGFKSGRINLSYNQLIILYYNSDNTISSSFVGNGFYKASNLLKLKDLFPYAYHHKGRVCINKIFSENKPTSHFQAYQQSELTSWYKWRLQLTTIFLFYLPKSLKVICEVLLSIIKGIDEYIVMK
jgi:hypothetical protein